jgi:uncharacterized protein YkwD
VRLRSIGLALLAALLLVPTGASAAVAAPISPTPAASPVGSYSDRVLALTNRERTSRRLRPLVLSTCADGYADSWAASLSRAGALSHQPLRPILTACRARGVGENVAYGNVTPEQLVAMWMASPGHRANLLKPEFTHIGVGPFRRPAAASTECRSS